jgi:threonine aldolase
MAAERTVTFRGDGEPRSPGDHLRRLVEIEAAAPIESDDYSRGGAVERLERAMAEELGKEAAIFVPTGTLANLLALERHCRSRGRRVLVQEQGHVYCDTGDGATLLAGLNLIPLAPGRATFGRDEVAAALERADGGRVETPVGALAIESPVRRQHGRVMPLEEMRAVTALCRERGIPTHLDGARLYMMAAATGVPVREYSALFDSVYVSLWKYLGAPFGAILAGQAAFVEGMYHQRRAYGGGLPHAALAAALALDGLPGFADRFAHALARARDLFAAVDRLPGAAIAPLPDGSNIFPLDLDVGVDRAAFVRRLADAGVLATVPPAGTAYLTVNPTILRRPIDELLAAFADALR